MKDHDEDGKATGEINLRIRHKIPKVGRIRDDLSRAFLERCLNLVAYELGKIRVSRRGKIKKLPHPERAHHAIDTYIEQLAELDQELFDATIYDLGLDETLADQLERVELIKIRDLVKLTIEDLKFLTDLNIVQEEELVTKLAEIGEYFVGARIPKHASKKTEAPEAAEEPRDPPRLPA